MKCGYIVRFSAYVWSVTDRPFQQETTFFHNTDGKSLETTSSIASDRGSCLENGALCAISTCRWRRIINHLSSYIFDLNLKHKTKRTKLIHNCRCWWNIQINPKNSIMLPIFITRVEVDAMDIWISLI